MAPDAARIYPYYARSLYLSLPATASFIAAWFASAAIYGAIPFVTLPTLGQAIWASGFAQSFANAGWPAIFANNFGYPTPAPIAFGLAGAFLESTLIALAGMHAADAYSLMAMLYLGLALWGALKYAQALGLMYFPALAAGMAWISSPIVWGHAGYSMLSLGIALLPFYLWVALLLGRCDKPRWRPLAARAAGFVAVAVLAVFMDGYTYMMFLVGTAVQYACALCAAPRSMRYGRLLWVGLPAIVFGVVVSCTLYQAYIGFTGFLPPPMDFFRGWGSDITTLLLPTKGLLWLWDTLGAGVPRSRREYFGDESVWLTTFSAVFILLGTIGFWITRSRERAYPLLILAIFGTYMSLGPSLKVHSVRPQQFIEAGNLDPMMPAEVAVAPTGSALISEHLPGFNQMRASYRWLALGLFGFWALYVLLSLELQRSGRCGIAVMLALLAVIAHLPNPEIRTAVTPAPHIPIRLRVPLEWRAGLLHIDEELALPLRQRIMPGSLVAFIPTGNDFLANYLSAMGRFKTYNVGGDKNLGIARGGWPASLRNPPPAAHANLSALVREILLRGEADYVVIPFIDLLWHAHDWPPGEESVRIARDVRSAALGRLESSAAFQVTSERYFAIVSLNRCVALLPQEAFKFPSSQAYPPPP
jgi:hypothetical protein